MISKRLVLAVVAICAVIAALVVVFVRGVVSQRGTKIYEGYYAPVYSTDGKHVFFVERRTSGTADETESGGLFFGSSKFDVFVEKDTFSLKRLHVQSGQVMSELVPERNYLRNFEAHV